MSALHYPDGSANEWSSSNRPAFTWRVLLIFLGGGKYQTRQSPLSEFPEVKGGGGIKHQQKASSKLSQVHSSLVRVSRGWSEGRSNGLNYHFHPTFSLRFFHPHRSQGFSPAIKSGIPMCDLTRTGSASSVSMSRCKDNCLLWVAKLLIRLPLFCLLYLNYLSFFGVSHISQF